MKIKLHTGEVFDVDLPKTDHTYDEILSELTDKDKDVSDYLLRLVKEWPQTKQVVSFFYDYIFATNLKDAETGFIKGILSFPPTYEAEEVLFSLFDTQSNLGLPCLLGNEIDDKYVIIYFVRTLIQNIHNFGYGLGLGNIWTWKQIRLILEECLNSNNRSFTWNKKLKEVEYNLKDVNDLYDKNPDMGDNILYIVDLSYKN